MDVLFAVEAGAAFGLGHLMRCRTLARECARRGGHPAVAIRGDAGVFDRWPWPGAVFSLPETAERAADAALALARARAVRWLVADGYGLAALPLLEKAREAGFRTLALDDIAEAKLAADVVLNQNAEDPGLYAQAAPGAQLLLGPRFALVAPEIRAARQSDNVADEIRRVLVVFGGADRKRVTPRVINCLAAEPRGFDAVDVVVGPYHAAPQPPDVASLPLRYHAAPQNLASLIAGSDLVISASGSTCWEVCCIGRPLVAVETAANQRQVSATLRRAGAALTLDLSSGGFCDCEFMAVWHQIQAADVRARLAMAARRLIDGLGPTRVADALGW